MLLVVTASVDLKQTSLQEEYHFEVTKQTVYFPFSPPLTENNIKDAFDKAESVIKKTTTDTLKAFNIGNKDWKDNELDQLWKLVKPNGLTIQIDHVIDGKKLTRYDLNKVTEYNPPSPTSWKPYLICLGAYAAVKLIVWSITPKYTSIKSSGPAPYTPSNELIR